MISTGDIRPFVVWLLIEIRPMIETAVIQLLQAEPRFEATTVHKDTAHHPRIAQAQRKE